MEPDDLYSMSASEDYKLSRVGSGDSSKSVTKSTRINAIQNLIKSQAHGQPYSRSGVPRALGPGWVVHRKPRSLFIAGGGSQNETPFEVIDIPSTDPNAIGTLIGVVSNSHLFNSEARDFYEYDNSLWGLLDDSEEPDDPHAWRGNYLGDKIWLQIELDPDDQSIISVDIMHGAVGTEDMWTTYPDPIEINTDDPDNPYQQFYHQIIAEITDPDTDPRDGLLITNDAGQQVQVTQILFADLMMTTGVTTNDADQPGLELLVAIPWNMLAGTSTDGEADEINEQSDVSTPYRLGSLDTGNDYNFALFNASDEDGPKVLILDGQILSPNSNPDDPMSDGTIDPDGMPSDDTYTLDVDDGDEIWVGMTWSQESDDNVSGDFITSAWLDHGPTTPDDDGLTQYITIGHVDVDINEPESIDVVYPRNEVLGDIKIVYPPSLDSDVDLAFVVDKDTGNKVWKKVCAS